MDSVGFIKPTQTFSDRGFGAMQEDHKNKNDAGEFDLKQYVEITEEGSAYLSIRKSIEAEYSGSQQRA